MGDVWALESPKEGGRVGKNASGEACGPEEDDDENVEGWVRTVDTIGHWENAGKSATGGATKGEEPWRKDWMPWGKGCGKSKCWHKGKGKRKRNGKHWD